MYMKIYTVWQFMTAKSKTKISIMSTIQYVTSVHTYIPVHVHTMHKHTEDGVSMQSLLYEAI